MSKPGITEYIRPADLDEAWRHISPGDPGVRLLSGGADLTIHAPPEVSTLVDVGRILDKTISIENDGAIRIGAMATLTDVLDHPEIASVGGGVVPEMMVHVGNPLLRNFSTIGGHVARGKLSDVVPVLLALDTDVHLFDGETRTVGLDEYYSSDLVKDPHIVTALTLRALPPRSAAAFLRFARTAFDFAILNVACRVDLDGPDVAKARIVLGATPRRSQRASKAESHLLESGLSDVSIEEAGSIAKDEIWTGGGWVVSAEYRSHLVEVLTRRCLGIVAERLEEK